jgi:hypothetical protein
MCEVCETCCSSAACLRSKVSVTST